MLWAYPSLGDDLEFRLETIINEVKTLEELLLDIERPKSREVQSYEIQDKIKVTLHSYSKKNIEY